ncbi:hypothetical protein L218DRAFT_1079917 [Marasmius fiardii PR-910]|nr:hypothetical protein L218DRAFT_1079917 [Marasmius fiardii PR-910]
MPWTRPPTLISIPKPGSLPRAEDRNEKPRTCSSGMEIEQQRLPPLAGASSVHSRPSKATSEHEPNADWQTTRTGSEPCILSATPDINDCYADTLPTFRREKRVCTSRHRKAQGNSTEGQTTTLRPIEINLSELSHSQFKKLFACKTDTLPVYTGPLVSRSEREPVVFPERFRASGRMMELFTWGHEGSIQERVYELMPSWKREANNHQIFYFPARHFFVHEQHAVIMGPASQSSKEHRFKLTSPFERIYGKTGHFFYAYGPVKNKQIFYGGRYRCVKLADHFPEGFIYSGGSLVLWELGKEIVESQTEGVRLRLQDALNLLKEKKVTLEFVMLQLIDFEMDTYRALTSGGKVKKTGATRKRKREA